MKTSNDDGVIAVLLERFNKQRLPRLLDIKKKVDIGKKLEDFDIVFLEEVLKDASSNMHLGDKHTELHELVAKVIHLYHSITEQALKNEQVS